MRRTQLYIDEEEHARLTALSRLTGKSISELVREAIRQIYGEDLSPENKLALLNSAIGIWKNRKFSTEAYVRRLRKGRGRLNAMLRAMKK